MSTRHGSQLRIDTLLGSVHVVRFVKLVIKILTGSSLLLDLLLAALTILVVTIWIFVITLAT